MSKYIVEHIDDCLVSAYEMAGVAELCYTGYVQYYETLRFDMKSKFVNELEKEEVFKEVAGIAKEK